MDHPVDETAPSVSRIYDFVLGGSANFEVDRAAAREMLAVWPGEQAYAWINRDFLRRAVTEMCASGIDQFLDLGSGIPTAGNVHEIAAGLDPEARVAYVDIDPIAVEHARALLGHDEHVTATLADVRDPGAVLSAPGVAGLLDFSRPVAVLAVAIFDILDTPDPRALVGRYRDVCVPGSALVMSNGSQMDISDAELATIRAIQAETTTPTLTLRSADEVTALFEGYDLLEPGVVPSAAWRPEAPVSEADAARSNSFGAVGILRAQRASPVPPVG